MPLHSAHKWPVIINNVKMSVEPSQQKSIDLDAIKAANDSYIVLRKHLKKALTNKEKELFVSWNRNLWWNVNQIWLHDKH